MSNQNSFSKKIRKKNFKKIFLFSVSLIILLFFMIELDFFSPIYLSGLRRFGFYISDLFKFKSEHPDLPGRSLWLWNLKYLWITLKSVTGGTVLGIILAFFTSYFSSTNIHLGRKRTYVIKFILVFFRAFPIVMFILLFKAIFSAFLAAFAIFFWSTWLWMHKYFMEIIESSNTKYFWIDVNLGKGKFKSFYKNILLVNKNRYAMNSLLSYESNVRWSSVLGTIGIIGIGFIIDYNRNDFVYLGISLFYIFLVVFSIEIFMFLYNKYLKEFIYKKTKNINYNRTFIYNRNRIILIIIKTIITIVFILSLVDLLKESVNIRLLKNYTQNFFIFDFTDISQDPMFYYRDYLVIFMKTYVSLYFATFFSILYAFLMSEKVSKSFIAIFFKGLLVIIKSIPVSVYFLLFNTFLEGITAITIVLFLAAFRSLAKHINSKINSYSDSELKLYISLGLTKWQIYKKRILPEALKDILSLVVFEFENTSRNGVSYGVFATITITSKISFYQDRGLYNRIFPLLLPIFLFFIVLEITYWAIKNRDKLWKVKNNLFKKEFLRKNNL
ncbi:ABC transporter permease [Mycoplasmopsis canis]|nr:ABC transporter permease [Mycoplasmopsis canis]